MKVEVLSKKNSINWDDLSIGDCFFAFRDKEVRIKISDTEYINIFRNEMNFKCCVEDEIDTKIKIREIKCELID